MVVVSWFGDKNMYQTRLIERKLEERVMLILCKNKLAPLFDSVDCYILFFFFIILDTIKVCLPRYCINILNCSNIGISKHILKCLSTVSACSSLEQSKFFFGIICRNLQKSIKNVPASNKWCIIGPTKINLKYFPNKLADADFQLVLSKLAKSNINNYW